MDRIQAERVGKRYVIGERRNAREALVAAGRRVVGRGGAPAGELWPLRDVSFSVPEGTSLGVVGRNGAGKSTLLKVLAGITAPTTGTTRTRGRVAALLEVGTGFHPELTGRENVYLNGAILGMSRRDTSRRFADIVEFSGVERFLDTPVKRFSSGMYLRLAFSVAAHLEPDILIVDEILAVGDAEFQRKCLGQMEEAERQGRTLVFVSHDLETLSRLCPTSLWLDGGSVREQGPSREVVRSYLASSSAGSGPGAITAGAVTVLSARVLVADGSQDVIVQADAVRIEVVFHVAEQVSGLDLAVYVTTRNGVRVFDEALSDHGSPRIGAGTSRLQLTVPPVLNVGDFTLGLWFGTAHEDLLDEAVVTSFTVHGSTRNRPDRVVVLGLPMTVEPVVPAS